MSEHFPPIEPYDRGMLDGGEGHQANWECCGNHAGKPALYLHGGLAVTFLWRFAMSAPGSLLPSPTCDGTEAIEG
jgi:hypothetical protein